MTQAKHGDKVRIHYTGKLGDGTVFDSSGENDPLEFVIGKGDVIKGLEEAVVGMGAGESKVVQVEAEKAFGAYKKEMVVAVERSHFPPDLKIEAGQLLQVPQEGGKTVVVTVAEADDSTVMLDVNHPLAGKDITLDIRLVDISL